MNTPKPKDMIKENKIKVMDNKINITLKKQFNGKTTNLPKIKESLGM